MMSSDLAQVLKNRRKALGLTVKTVLERLNVYGVNISDKTFYGWESGHRQPDSDTFLTLCRIYGIDSLSVFSSDNESTPLYSSEAEAMAKDYDRLDEHGRKVVRIVLDEEKSRMEKEAEKQRQAEAGEQRQAALAAQAKIDMEAAEEVEPEVEMRDMIVYLNPAATGTPLFAESDYDRLSFPEDEIPYGADCGVRISGHSMAPKIPDRSIVWVHQTPSIDDGEVGIFSVDGDFACKRFRRIGSRSIRLESDNPDYGPVELHTYTDVRLFGKVVGVMPPPED